MSFTELNGVITQEGANPDLSGLAALAGVTITSSNGRAIYQLTNTQLVVNGTLTIDPELEELFFTGYGNVITFQVNTGTLNIGQEVNIGAVLNRFSSGTVARFDRDTDSSYQETNSDFYVSSDGTVNWYGGSMFSRRVFAIYGTLNTFSKNCQWINQATVETQVRQRSSNCAIDGLVTKGSFLTLIANASKIDNWTPYETPSQAIGLSTSTPADTWLTLKGFDSRGLDGQALAFWRDKWARLINNYTGSDIVAAGNSGDDPGNTGLFEIRQELTFSYSDLDGVSQDGVKVYMVDTDNSNRIGASVIGTNPSYTADRAYTGTSASGDVTFNTDGGVLVAVLWRDTGGLRLSNNEVDYRCVAGDDTDDFVFNSISYQFNINQASIILKGSQSDSRNIVMLPDTSITNSDEDAVDLYTVINDIATDGYDSLKLYLSDNYLGEKATIAGRSGNQLLIGSRDLYLNKNASNVRAYNGTTITLKTDEATQGASGTGDVYVQNGTLLNGGTFDCDISYDSGVGTTISNITCTGTIDFTQAGTYTILDSTINEVINTSLGTVIIQLAGTTTITTNLGPLITILEPVSTVTVNGGLQAGSQLVGFEAGTTTEVYRNNSTGTSEVIPNINYGTYDYTIMKAGYFPLRITNYEINSPTATIGVSQELDRAYEAPSSLVFGSISGNTYLTGISGNEFEVTTDTTVQNFYSAWVDFWIAEPTLVNKTFPISPFGTDSFSFNDDYEFTSSSIQYLSRDGFRYVNISGGTTAQYCAVLTQGVVAGSQVEYQQGFSLPIDDATNTGNMDQVVQFFGDATHGNFDYTNLLDLKVQTNGYREAEFDIVSNFGSLEERLYISNLAEIDIAGLTLGDPGISGVTLTDDSGSPITWDTGNAISGSFSITITDTNNNTGENILRWLNYNLSLDADFQGKDPFRWPEMVLDTGSTYETIRGTLHTTTGDVEAGVRVIDISGNPHPDFTRFQTDDGTYRVSPIRARANFTNLTASNVRIYDDTGTEVEQYINTSSDHTYLTPIGATGTYGYVINRAGYEPIIGTFDPTGTTVTVDGTLSQKTLSNGDPAYTGSSSLFLSVQPLGDGTRMYLDIGNGAVAVQEAFDQVENELQSSLGMEYLYNGGGQVAFSLRSAGSFFDMGIGVRLRNPLGEVNATLNGFAESVDGIVVEGSNSILYNTVSDADKIASHQGAVWIDTTSSISGSNFPSGTSFQPVNNLANALVIAENLGLVQIRVGSTLTIDEDVSGYRISPGGGTQTLILDASGNVQGCVVEEFFVTGTQAGSILMKNCSLNNLSGMQGTYRNVGFGAAFSVESSAVRLNLFDCYSTVAGDTKPQCDLTGTDGLECNVRAWSGGFQLDNCTGVNNKVSIDVISSSIKLSSTVTEGDIVVRGIGDIVDESGPNAIVNISGFNPNLDEIRANQPVMNGGIKKASKLIPYSTDL